MRALEIRSTNCGIGKKTRRVFWFQNVYLNLRIFTYHLRIYTATSYHRATTTKRCHRPMYVLDSPKSQQLTALDNGGGILRSSSLDFSSASHTAPRQRIVQSPSSFEVHNLLPNLISYYSSNWKQLVTIGTPYLFPSSKLYWPFEGITLRGTKHTLYLLFFSHWRVVIYVANETIRGIRV